MHGGCKSCITHCLSSAQYLVFPLNSTLRFCEQKKQLISFSFFFKVVYNAAHEKKRDILTNNFNGKSMSRETARLNQHLYVKIIPQYVRISITEIIL